MPFPAAFAFVPPEVQTLRPPADLSLYDMQNPRRPLTTSEVRNNVVDSYCCCMGGIVGELDVGRLTRCVEHLYALYPYLDSAVVWDEGLRWYRFDPRPHTPIDLQATMGYVSDAADLARWYPYTHRVLTPEHQTEWHLLKVIPGPLPGVTSVAFPGWREDSNGEPGGAPRAALPGEMGQQNGVPDGPGGLAYRPDTAKLAGASLDLQDFSYILLFLVPHSLGDGSSFSAFYRRLNEFYVMPEERFAALEREVAEKRARGERVALQLSNYRHLCACPLDTRVPAPGGAQGAQGAPGAASGSSSGPAPAQNPMLQLLPSCIKVQPEYDEEHPVPEETRQYLASLPPVLASRPEEMFSPTNLILRFPASRYYRIPGCPMSHCLNSYSVALAFAWAVIRGVAEPRGPGGEALTHMTSVHDVRRAYDFAQEKGRLRDLDLTCDTMGLGTQIIIRTARVSVDSSVRDVAQELIDSEARFAGQTDAGRWAALVAPDLAPISRTDFGILRATACVSNLGVVNLLPREAYWPSPAEPQKGPIRMFCGAAGGDQNRSPAAIGTYILCSSREHGSFMSFGANPKFFGPQHAQAFLCTWMMIQDLCRSEGAEKVTLGRCVELLREELCAQGVTRYD